MLKANAPNLGFKGIAHIYTPLLKKDDIFYMLVCMVAGRLTFGCHSKINLERSIIFLKVFLDQIMDYQ